MSPARRRRVVADGSAVRALHGSEAWALRPCYDLCLVSLGFTGCPGASSPRGRASSPDAAAVAEMRPGSASREAACQLLRPGAFGPSATHIAALHPLASPLRSPSVTSAWQALLSFPDPTTAFSFCVLQCHLPQFRSSKKSLTGEMAQRIKACAAKPYDPSAQSWEPHDRV